MDGLQNIELVVEDGAEQSKLLLLLTAEHRR